MEAIDKGHEEIALRIIEAGASPHIQHEVDFDITTVILTCVGLTSHQ